jgi:hypothetical protein
MAEIPRFKAYRPNSESPLFIRVVNKQACARDIALGMIDSSRDDKSREIASLVAEQNPELDLFVGDLVELLRDIISNGVSPTVRHYLNSYMSSSLLMHNAQDASGNTVIDKTYLSIISEDTPWLEAIVCFNLSIYIKSTGTTKLKECPVCSRFFVNGKMDYKFCSESCKSRGA